MNKILIFFLFLANVIPCYSQGYYDIIDSLHIQRDIENLDLFVHKKIKKDRSLSSYKNIRLFHVLDLYKSNNEVIKREDYNNYNFLSKLECKYSILKDSRCSKKRRILNATTYVIVDYNRIVEVYHNGNSQKCYMLAALQGKVKRFNKHTQGDETLDFKLYDEPMCNFFLDNRIQFAIRNGIQTDFRSLDNHSTIIVMDMQLYVITSDSHSVYLIPMDQYLKKEAYNICEGYAYPKQFILENTLMEKRAF